MKLTKYSLALLAIIVAVVIWGLSFLSIKVTVVVIPPMTLALLRFILATVLLFGVKCCQESSVKVASKDLPLLALAGLIGITLYFYFENNGVKLIPASAASIIIAVIPIMTLLTEALLFKVKLSALQFSSVILSVVGVYMVVGGVSNQLVIQPSTRGYWLMLGAAISWVIYCLVTRPLFDKYSQLTIVYYQTLFGTLAFIPFAFWEKTNWSAAFNGVIIGNVIFMGVFCSALAYYLYVYALNHLGANLSAIFLNLIPVISALGAWFLLKERLQFLQILGGILVVVAVTVANWGAVQAAHTPKMTVSDVKQV